MGPVTCFLPSRTSAQNKWHRDLPKENKLQHWCSWLDSVGPVLWPSWFCLGLSLVCFCLVPSLRRCSLVLSPEPVGSVWFCLVAGSVKFCLVPSAGPVGSVWSCVSICSVWFCPCVGSVAARSSFSVWAGQKVHPRKQKVHIIERRTLYFISSTIPGW